MAVLLEEEMTWPRIARVCKVDGCNARNFGDPDWECDKHPGKTIDQPNRPYQGHPVPVPEPPKKPEKKKGKGK